MVKWFSTGAKVIEWGKDDLPTNGAREIGYPYVKKWT